MQIWTPLTIISSSNMDNLVPCPLNKRLEMLMKILNRNKECPWDITLKPSFQVWCKIHKWSTRVNNMNLKACLIIITLEAIKGANNFCMETMVKILQTHKIHCLNYSSSWCFCSKIRVCSSNQTNKIRYMDKVWCKLPRCLHKHNRRLVIMSHNNNF